MGRFSNMLASCVDDRLYKPAISMVKVRDFTKFKSLLYGYELEFQGARLGKMQLRLEHRILEH